MSEAFGAGFGQPLVAMLLIAPLAYAALRAGVLTRASWLINDARTGLLATAASIVCGNVGIGTFVALSAFAAESPLVGASLAGAYATGLFLCAAIAPRIHALARESGAYGLVDLIATRHNVRRPLLVWVPIACVFLLRVTVQLIALSLILAAIFGLGAAAAIAAAALLVGGYTVLGGYKVAVESDLLQAVLILVGATILAAGLAGREASAPISLFALGPYEPYFVVAIWLFLPPSVCLAVDNWQRMATAVDPGTARLGFLLAAPPCAFAYAAIVWSGLVGPGGGDVLATFRALMPEGLEVVADLMLVAAIASSIDTYVMPLMTTLGGSKASLAALRAKAAAVFAACAVLALAIGDVLDAVVAAFNALVVFLPAVVAAVLPGPRRPWAAILSLNAGVCVTLALTLVVRDSAAILGFIASCLVYWFANAQRRT